MPKVRNLLRIHNDEVRFRMPLRIKHLDQDLIRDELNQPIQPQNLASRMCKVVVFELTGFEKVDDSNTWQLAANVIRVIVGPPTVFT